MFEWVRNIIASLNDYAGLFSLLALIMAIVVPWSIYRRNKRNHRREMQNELDAINEAERFTMTADRRQHYISKRKLEKNLKD